jgi:hypothetical protein
MRKNMKIIKAFYIAFAAIALTCGISSPVSAATVTDTLDVLNPGSGTTFWAPSGSEGSAPFYRGNTQNWEWQHGAISGNVTSATLQIDAFDVDEAEGEVDEIFGFNNDTSTWDLIGVLTGSSANASSTSFILGSSWFDEIGLGLRVMLNIDKTNAGWFVSLSNSSLSAETGEIPIPATFWLFGSALVGLLGIRKKTYRLPKI